MTSRVYRRLTKRSENGLTNESNDSKCSLHTILNPTNCSFKTLLNLHINLAEEARKRELSHQLQVLVLFLFILTLSVLIHLRSLSLSLS